jgi:hypothetical protein
MGNSAMTRTSSGFHGESEVGNLLSLMLRIGGWTSIERIRHSLVPMVSPSKREPARHHGAATPAKGVFILRPIGLSVNPNGRSNWMSAVIYLSPESWRTPMEKDAQKRSLKKAKSAPTKESAKVLEFSKHKSRNALDKGTVRKKEEASLPPVNFFGCW